MQCLLASHGISTNESEVSNTSNSSGSHKLIFQVFPFKLKWLPSTGVLAYRLPIWSQLPVMSYAIARPPEVYLTPLCSVKTGHSFAKLANHSCHSYSHRSFSPAQRPASPSQPRLLFLKKGGQICECCTVKCWLARTNSCCSKGLNTYLL